MANAKSICESDSASQKLDLSVINSQGNTPLHAIVAKTYTYETVEESDIKTLKLMLKFNPDVNIQNAEGYTSVHLAIKNKRSDALVQVLLDDGGKCDYNFADKKGCSALYHAVSPISFKLDTNVNVKYTNFNFKFRDASIIKLLVEKGAKIDTAAKNGYSPLLLAVIMQKTDYVKVMLVKDGNMSEGGIENSIKTSFCKGYSGSCYPPTEYYHMTPLQIAVYDDNKEMAQLLIKAGANVNAVNKETSTWYGYQECNKMTPLLISVFRCNLEMVQILIKGGVTVNAVNPWGNNALHMIIESHVDRDATDEQTNIAKLLIDSGVDINAKDRSGETALHLAINRNKEDIVTHILKKGLATL